MRKILILFFIIFSLSHSFEVKKENFKITKNKNLKILEAEMKSQSDKVVEVFHKEISDRIESKNKIIGYSENTNLETGEKNLKVNLPDVLLNNKFYEKTIFEIKGVNFSSKNKVEVKPNVKIQKMELEQNNLEIEKRFTEMTKKEISNGIKEIDQQINSEKEAVELKFFGEISKGYLKNMKYEIKKIEYTSSSKANLTINFKIPKFDNDILNGEQEKINKLFEKRTGKSIEYLAKASSKEFQKKWLPVLVDIISEIVSEKINNIKEFEEKETIVKAEKINGKWDIITKN